VWGSSASDVWLVGAGSTILHWDGNAWSTGPGVPNPDPAGSISRVSGNAAANVWAIGVLGGATVSLHWTGASWAQANIQVSVRLHDISSTGPYDAWVVGDRGTIMRWDGGSWTGMESDTGQDLFAVWGVSQTEAWALGRNGTIVRYLP
jgi:hypothetical protein